MLALILAISVGFVMMVRSFLMALALAFIFSALLDPIYQRVLSWTRGQKALASILVLVGSLLVIGIPLAGIASLVATEAVQVSETVVPWLKQQVQRDAGENHLSIPDWLPGKERLQPYKATLLQKVSEWAGDLFSFFLRQIKHATQGAASFVINLLVMIYAMFFFLMHGTALMKVIVEYLPLNRADSEAILRKGLVVTAATLKSILVIGVIQGTLLGAAFWLADIQGAVFWGSVVLVAAAIPGLGSPMVWIPAVIYLFINNRFTTGIILAFWCAVIVGSIDNILRPRLVGQETKLPDLLILVSTLGGITAFGPVGIILGPVIAGMFVTALGIYREVFL